MASTLPIQRKIKRKNHKLQAKSHSLYILRKVFRTRKLMKVLLGRQDGTHKRKKGMKGGGRLMLSSPECKLNQAKRKIMLFQKK